jgi:hypothetical protein
VAVATGAAALAEEVIWVASVEPKWVASAEVTMAPAMAEVTMAMEDTMGMAMEDVITVTAITALIARITRHTDGRTPAPTEWCADSEVPRARLSQS